MGLDRRHDDPHAGPWFVPKLTVTGRLVGVVDGRPVQIVGEGHRLRLVPSGILDAWRLRGDSVGVVDALAALARTGVGLEVSVGSWSLEVLPRPHMLIRWFGGRLNTQ